MITSGRGERDDQGGPQHSPNGPRRALHLVSYGVSDDRIERALEDDYLSRDPSPSTRAAYIRRTMARREIGLCCGASVGLFPSPRSILLGSKGNTVVRISLSASSRQERSIEQAGSLPVCLSVWRSMCRATCSPAHSDVTLSFPESASARLRGVDSSPKCFCGSPSTDSVHSPREELGDGTPSGQACTADSGQNQKKRSPTPCSTKSSSSADSVRARRSRSQLKTTVSSFEVSQHRSPRELEER